MTLRSRRRLLVVAHSADLYGADRALLTTLPELTKRFSVTIAVPADGPAVDAFLSLPIDDLLRLPDYGVRRANLAPNRMATWSSDVLRSAMKATSVHRRAPFSLIYSNTLACMLGNVLAPLWRVPHVQHIHEAPTGSAMLFRLSRATSDLLIYNSHYTRWLLTNSHPEYGRRSTVILNGIEFGDRLRPGLPSDTLRVACVGRIHPKKGQEVLIEAARIARRRGTLPRWELHFYGDALPVHQQRWDALRARVDDAGLRDHVHWHGFVDDQNAMYTDADLVVVPSVVPEEFSLVAIEAQAFGVPVIATGPGGPSETIVDGRTGVIIPPRDPEAIVDAVERLGADPSLRTRMGTEGSERVRQLFSAERYTQAVVEACEGVLADSPSPVARRRSD